MRSLSICAGLLLLVCAPLALSAEPPPTKPARVRLPAEQVVDNLVRMNGERAAALPSYRSTRLYRLEYRGFPGSRSAEMVVEMTYAPPGQKEFVVRSQSGSKLILDRVFKKILESEKEAFDAENQKRIALNRDNYVFTLADFESTPEGDRYVFVVEPKKPSKFLYRGKIWVDADDFAVVRIVAEPAKNPSFWVKNTQIEQLYGKVDRFWLPVSNHSVSAVRLGGHADFSIEYKDYQLSPVVNATVGAPAQ